MSQLCHHDKARDVSNPIRIGHAIRTRRKELSLTLQDMAPKSGLSIGFLSLVERDLAYPSLSALVNIAAALDLPLEKLISTPKGSGVVSKAKERRLFSLRDEGVKYVRLSTTFTDSKLHSVEIILPPGFESETVTHYGEELIYVIAGTVTQVLDGEAYELCVGDCAHFQSTVRHQWANYTDEPAKLIWVGDLPIFPNESKKAGKDGGT